MTERTIRIGGAALRGPMRVLSVALCAVFVLVLVRYWDKAGGFEASAVLQIRPGAEALSLIEARLLTRETLEATAARQGVGSALDLAEAVALHPLRTLAGETLGLPPQTVGLIVAVRLADPDQAVRVANDLALQTMDLGQAGQIDAGAEALNLYRAEEDRLWQEIAALRSDPGLDAAGQRKLGLMQDEYAAVRAKLAAAEVDARVDGRLRAAPYVLLARAQEAHPVAPPHRQALTGLAAAALALALMSAMIGREISWPFRSTPSADSGRNRSS